VPKVRVNDATPFGFSAEALAEPSAVSVTDPVGTAAPFGPDTVTVNVTGSPATDGFVEERMPTVGTTFGGADVVAVAAGESPDVPEALEARTVHRYVVPAASPVSVKTWASAATVVRRAGAAVPVLRHTWYDVAPADAVHDSDAVLVPVAVAVNDAGAVGTVVTVIAAEGADVPFFDTVATAYLYVVPGARPLSAYDVAPVVATTVSDVVGVPRSSW
jgi:hypothetical protein